MFTLRSRWHYPHSLPSTDPRIGLSPNASSLHRPGIGMKSCTSAYAISSRSMILVTLFLQYETHSPIVFVISFFRCTFSSVLQLLFLFYFLVQADFARRIYLHSNHPETVFFVLILTITFSNFEINNYKKYIILKSLFRSHFLYLIVFFNH